MSVNQLENVAPEPDPASTAPQAEPTPLEQKYGGDVRKMNAGYWNLNQELSRKNEILSQALPRLERMEAVVGALLGGGGGQPADPTQALAEELGMASSEPLKNSLRGEVETVLTQLFGPFVQQMSADEQLSEEIPNFEQLRGQARVFMKANPEVAETFNAVRGTNPKAAWKYAIRESLIAANSRPTPTAAGASLPGSAAPAGRGAPQPAVNQRQREEEAAEYGRQYGDFRPYASERFKGTSIERAVQRALQQAGHVIPNEGW